MSLLRTLEPQGLAISLITYGEIYDGIYSGSSPQRQERIFRQFLQGTDVLPLNKSIMKRFARIRGQLRRTGNIISDPDILIAATALHHKLTVVTRNIRHFERIPDLNLYQPR